MNNSYIASYTVTSPNVKNVHSESGSPKDESKRYNIDTEWRRQIAASFDSRGDHDMANNEYELFLKDIKDDLREREARNEYRYNQIHEELIQQNQDTQKRDEQFRKEAKEREDRYFKDAHDREERILKAFDEAKLDMRDSKNFIKSTSENLHQIMTANIWGWIATFIAIAGIVLTVILTR